jgi:hypothetical protein
MYRRHNRLSVCVRGYEPPDPEIWLDKGLVGALLFLRSQSARGSMNMIRYGGN